jgi:lysyl-tRNA synthetase class 2
VRETFLSRSRLLSSLRATLERQGFLEVETPMMHAIPGGAAGEPFKTHHKALDTDLYLRLAPELHLKQLLVGGLERVYELNRSFRNEGLSTKHNPEFTMLEAYQAYGDAAAMMRLVEELICDAARSLRGALTIEFQGQRIDLTPPWGRVSFAETMAQMGLGPAAPLAKIQAVLEQRGLKVKGLTRSQLVRLVEQLFEPKARPKPLFVVDYWTELSPLAKAKPEDPRIADRFELYIGGMEVANAYSELNDPLEQRERLMAEIREKGKEATSQNLDEDFLLALEHGMPPAGGLGLGIDRLIMVLTGRDTIREVVLFPQLKPEKT